MESALKERFQHRNIGDRESPLDSTKASRAKVLRIGPDQSSSSQSSSSIRTSPDQVRDRSSFTTSFGKAPGSISGGSNGKGRTSRKSITLLGGGDDDIDTFLDSLSKPSPVILSPSRRGTNSAEDNRRERAPSASGSGTSRSRLSSFDSDKDICDFQETLQTGASSSSSPSSLSRTQKSALPSAMSSLRTMNGSKGASTSKSESKRKEDVLGKLNFSGSRAGAEIGHGDGSEEGGKPKAKVENLEDFLDGMLG